MKAKDQQKPPATYKTLCRLMRDASHGHGLFDVFRDFLLMASCSISNSVDFRPYRETREAEYMATVKKYKPEQVALFPQMLAALTDALDGTYDDVLGQVFNELELHNKWAGQFFTPYSLCQLMARLLCDEGIKEKVAVQGYVTLNEPASGSGAMIIGFLDAMKAQGLNPQQQLHVTAIDVDIRAVHMTYLQLSLLGIPAVVIHGNTLTLEEHSHWYTPFHVLNGWTQKLRRPVTPITIRETARRRHVFHATKVELAAAGGKGAP